jgi:hypothetical protein
MKEFKEISEKSPFKVPENYFEEVNRKIIASTAGYSLGTKDKSLYRKFRPYLAVAASVALLTLLSYTVIYVISPGRNKTKAPEITLNEFTDNYLDEIDNMTLEEKAGFIDPDLADININSKDIIDYLVFENIEINDLHEQL